MRVRLATVAFVSAVRLAPSAPAQDVPLHPGDKTAQPLAVQHEWLAGHETGSAGSGLGGSWARLRGRFVEEGITPGFSWIVDTTSVLEGGARRRTTTRNLWALSLGLDMHELFGIEGGHAFAEYESHAGSDVTDDVGSFQSPTNIDEQHSIHGVAKIWYEQHLGDGELRVKVGKIDANTEFAYALHAREFLASSAGYSPTILGLPTYPDPSFGALAFWTPCEGGYIGAGLFDGSGNAGVRTGSRGPSSFFHEGSERFLIGEAGVSWRAGDAHDGRVGLGAWQHTGEFERFDGGTDGGTEGCYAVLDQNLWRADADDPTDPSGVGAYLMLGTADRDVSEVDLHVGAGLVWTAPFADRGHDAIGLAASTVHFSDQAPDRDESAETLFELFYHYQATGWLVLKPDLQYVRNPGGDSSLDDAIAFTLRARVDL